MDEFPTEEFITDLGAFNASLRYVDVPEDAVRLVERAVLDTVGVTLAGSATDEADRVTSMFSGEEGKTSVLGRGIRLPLQDAIFANATAGHFLDFDDVALAAMDGHPSVPMISPLLAVGAHEGATGEEIIAAYTAGFETQCYISRPISPGHYEKGWHATSTIGTFGTAAAIANLLQCSEDEVVHAINIAASMAAGLKRNFGSTTKSIHAGQAARSGTSAALAAVEGVTANPHATAGDGGFIDLYRGGEHPDPERVPDLGKRWALVVDGIDVKKYPCCYYTHAAIHAAIQLAETHDVNPANIDKVIVESSRGAADALAYARPTTGLEAKFSMQFVVAYGLAKRQVGLSAFRGNLLEDIDVEYVRKRVSFVADPDLPYDSNAATVHLTTRSGEEYELTENHPPGSQKSPLSTAELHQKYRQNANLAQVEIEVEDSLDCVDSLRDLADVSELVDQL